MTAYVDTMAYVGEIPWHKLGTYLGEENVDGARMQEAAGLGWAVRKAPIYTARITNDGSNLLHRVEGQYALECSDTQRPISNATVGSKYEPFQNSDLFAFGEAMRSEGDVRWHTAGSLMDRRKVWALAQLAGDVTVTRRNGVKDTSAPFILLYNSHDGSSCLTARLTTVRVVCWNTLSAALSEKGAEFRARHTVSMSARATEAAVLLGLAAQAIPAEREFLQGLADAPMSMAEFRSFACAILAGTDTVAEGVEIVRKSEGASRTQYGRKGDTLVRLFAKGLGNMGGDRFDALNAVTQYVDHAEGSVKHKSDTDSLSVQLNSAVFGMGERTKRRALQLLAA